MADRPRREITVEAAEGGWPHPWPNVAEIAEALPSHQWTLVGGLMTQLHAVHRGLGVVRPTNDVDIVLHIEASRGVPAQAAGALEMLGYRLQANVDPRDNTAHRWVRDGQVVDVGGALRSKDRARLHRDPISASDADLPKRVAGQVDVLTADHPASVVRERMRGRDMVPIDGGTQALNRTILAVLAIGPDRLTTISVPRPFAAVILKAAAYLADSRDPSRHLYDAATLLACIEDPFDESTHLGGSDRRRIRVLDKNLPDDHPAWLPLDGSARANARAALQILSSA